MTTTRDSFNHIARSWYNFRHWSRFRHELTRLAEQWREGRLLNIGCAHGPDFLPFAPGFELYGLDYSHEMIRLAQTYARKFNFQANLMVADAGYLPFASETFDRVISVAAYHHLRYPRERRAAFHELWRVLKPGGEVFITVWNRWQPRFWFRGRDITVPWHSEGIAWPRYHYLFSYRELENEVKKAGFSIISSFPENSYRFPLKQFSRNICLLARKGNLDIGYDWYSGNQGENG